MLLVNFTVSNYRNIEETGPISVDPEATCLVGKNESGKTTLLQALYRVNPIGKSAFDVTNDYPRRKLREYERQIASGKSHGIVVAAKFELTKDDIEKVEAAFGKCLKSTFLTFSTDYENKKYVSLETDESVYLSLLIDKGELSVGTTRKAKSQQTIDSVITLLTPETDDKSAAMLARLKAIKSRGSLSLVIWDEILKSQCPKFMFFSDYRIMKGSASLDTLANSALLEKDEGLLTLRELLDLAGVTPQDLKNDDNYEHHKANLESTENEITEKVFEYWKQNSNLEIEFDVHRPASGTTTAATFYVRIKNTRHKVTVPFDERSRGFVWFFSFLVAFRNVAHQNERLVILLDEPGLNLHASAQEDLLRFIDKELVQKGHQVIYSTHSPFMIPPTRLTRVRTVEDTLERGCVVSSECITADAGTMFPLQAALSYTLAQTLFVGPNCLLVEGASDLLYLQTMSAIARESKRSSLDERWVIIPVGGDRVSTFASVIGANQLNICAALDFAKGDEQKIQNLIKQKIIKEKNIFHFHQFTGGKEGDIEDMFTEDLYLELVNRSCGFDLKKKDLGHGNRLVKRVESLIASKGLTGFNHTKPAKVAVACLSNDIKVDAEVLNRFVKLFEAINPLLKT